MSNPISRSNGASLVRTLTATVKDPERLSFLRNVVSVATGQCSPAALDVGYSAERCEKAARLALGYSEPAEVMLRVLWA